MTVGQWLMVKNIQRRTFDSATRKRLEHRAFIDHGAAPDVDYDCFRLHGRELSLPDHPTRFCSQGCGYDYIITMGKHLKLLLRRVHPCDYRVHRIPRGMPLDGEHVHSERPASRPNRSPDVAIADDSNSLARYGQDVESLPHARLLIANHAAEVFRKIENRADRKLPERCAEHSRPIRERHR